MRQLKKGILDAMTRYTINLETSAIFTLWCGISAISAALGRDCCLDLGYFTIYPNMYIVLAASSAKCRKSTAIRIAGKFMKNCEPKIKVLSQKTTAEAIIGNLSGTSVKEENMLVNEADGILIVDEMVTLIDKNAFKSGLIPVLTSLYDCDNFKYETKARGIEEIVNPCLSILGGTTIENLKESIPIAAIGSGFTSRIMFIYKSGMDKIVAFPELSDEAKKLQSMIQVDLNDVVKLRGKFTLDKDAKQIYENEYVDFMENSKLFDDPNLDGYAGRRHVNLLKVAMVMSADLENKLIINRKDMLIAIAAMKLAEKDMSQVLKSVRSEFVGEVAEEVINLIRSYRTITRSVLVKKMSYRLSAQQLDIILNTLLEYDNDKGGKLLEIIKEGSRTSYKYCE